MSEPSQTIQSDELLPPITPPTGRFIVQLFVIPAVIVTVIVLLWMLLAGVVLRRSGDPDELIQGLASSSEEKRWQYAQQLADMLRDERHATFKQNEAAAGQLAQIIGVELRRADNGEKLGEKDVTLLMFAARALGEFRVDVGLPTLIQAASADLDEEAIDVRRAAIQALAVRTSHMKERKPSWTGHEYNLESTLLELAESDQRLVRSDAAFALGVLGTPPAIEKLAELVHDPYPDARYNAATALARYGDLRAIGTLAEMLDPVETAGLKYEDERPILQLHKRGTILVNAFRATERLAKANPTADFSELVQPLKQLVAADAQTLQRASIEPALASEAERVLKYLRAL
jgi:hypothetical protein